MNKIEFTLFTKDGGFLTKHIRPKPDGSGIEKDASQCWMSTGKAEKVSISALDQLGPFIRNLKFNQAIAHGICDHPSATVVADKNFSGQPGTITRTKSFFRYPDGPGIGMFDHDPKPGQPVLGPEDFRQIIENICPSFRNVATLWTPSTSSCIFDSAGKELNGISAGFHMYFVMAAARELPVFAETLFKRLCLAGHGYPFVTKAGSILLRTIFDSSIFSPERLDFVAGAVCEEGCCQRLPDPVFTEGGMLEWRP